MRSSHGPAAKLFLNVDTIMKQSNTPIQDNMNLQQDRV